MCWLPKSWLSLAQVVPKPVKSASMFCTCRSCLLHFEGGLTGPSRFGSLDFKMENVGPTSKGFQLQHPTLVLYVYDVIYFTVT